MTKMQTRQCDICGYSYTTDAHSWERASTTRVLDKDGKTIDEKTADLRHAACGGFMVVPAATLAGRR